MRNPGIDDFARVDPAGVRRIIGCNGEVAGSRRLGDGTFAKIGRRIRDRIAGEIQAVDDRCWCRKPAIPGAARLGAELNAVAGQRSLGNEPRRHLAALLN